MQATKLNSKLTHTLDQIYQHPVSHNLEWRDVVGLMEHVGAVEEKGNGHLTFTINGVSAGFHRAHGKDVSEVQEVLDLRTFLEDSGYGKNAASDTGAKRRLLVVIGQQEALIFRSEDTDSVPERLHPYDPHGKLHLLKHTEGADIDAHAPENLTYYKAIAKTLAGAEEILLMGNGTGASSAMNHLKDFLATNEPESAECIVGALTVDVEALSDGEMLQKARAFYTHRDGPESENP